jgi:hypothetical protein
VHEHFQVLSDIFAPHLKHILLHLTILLITDLEPFNLTRIEHILSEQRWANVQKLTIHLHCRGQIISAAPEIIKARLPILEDRGVLEVVLDDYLYSYGM